MYALYKVEVWIKSDLDSGTSLEKVLHNIDDLPSGKVDFVEDENYQTSTEFFVKPIKGGDATLKIFSDKGEELYTNKIN
jgi:hypothetical protein